MRRTEEEGCRDFRSVKTRLAATNVAAELAEMV
jgi:hypothetical protein